MADNNIIPPPPPGYQIQGGPKPVDQPPPPAGYQVQQPDQQQYLSAPGSGDVLANTLTQSPNLVVKDDWTKLPKSTATLAASLPTDPTLKIRYLAKSLFPDLSPDEAMSRFGTMNGRAYYIANDGQAYYAEPKFAPIKDPVTTAKDLGDTLAANAGPSLPVIGGMGGGAATDWMGGVPGAVAGGAVGDIVRQYLANLFTGEQKPFLDRVLQTGSQAALQGAGQGVGNLLNAGAKVAFERNPLKISTNDLSLATPQAMSAADTLLTKAAAYNVPLTPGEATNLPSLLVRQRQLGRNPNSMNILSDFYKNRNEVALPAAWDQMISGISTQGAPGVGARNLAEGAQATIDAAVAERKAVSKPLYDAVVNKQNVLSPADYNQLMASNPLFAQAIKDVRSDKILSADIADAPDHSLLALNQAKIKLDDMASEAGRAGNANKERIAGGAARDLAAKLDQLFPGYADARAAYAGKSPEVDALTEGITGLAAKDRATNYQQVPNTIFGPGADPISITTAKNAFAKAGQQDAWNDGLRSYLDNVYSAASKQDQGPAPQTWRNLMADTRQRANLKAAMTPEQYQAFNDLMDVFEGAKRTLKENSAMATDLGAGSDLRSPVAKAASAGLRGVKFWDIPSNVATIIDQASSNNGAKTMANVITSPDAIASLQRLKMLSPGTQKFNRELGYLTSAMLFGASKSGPANSLPPYMQDLPPNLQPTVQ